MCRYLSSGSELLSPHRLHQLVACSVQLADTHSQAPAFHDACRYDYTSPNSVYLLHRLQLEYRSVVQDARPGSEGTTSLALLQGEDKLDLEVGGDGYGPSSHVAGTSFQELHVLGPAGQHVLVGTLPDDVMLRVHAAAQLANAIHRVRPHHGQVFAVKMLVVDNLGAGGLYID